MYSSFHPKKIDVHDKLSLYRALYMGGDMLMHYERKLAAKKPVIRWMASQELDSELKLTRNSPMFRPQYISSSTHRLNARCFAQGGTFI